MVSQQRPVSNGLTNALFHTDSPPRVLALGIVAIVFLFALCIIPVSAEDPVLDIPCHSPHITNVITSTSPTGYAPLTITFTPQVTDCYECTYLWSITESVAGGMGTNYYHDRELTHTFTEPGGYMVQLRIFENLPICTGESSEATSYQSVNLREPAIIIAPVASTDCPDINAMTLSVYQSTEYSELAGQGARLPFWARSLSGSCPNCVYTWSIYKMTDTFVPVTLDSGDIFETYGRPDLQHRFTEPGDYKIYLRMENPPSCPYSGTSPPYASASVIHHVISPASTTVPTTIPVVRADVTDELITVTPGTTTRAPALVTTAAPVVTSTTSRQVTPEGTIAVTRTATTFPPANPAATSMLANAGTGSSVADVTPGVTATMGGSGTGTTATGGSGVTTTTLLLGVIAVLALVICAGVLYLVFKKK